MGAFSTGFSQTAFSVEDSVTPTVSESTESFQIVRKRKEVSQRVLLEDGTAITVRILDGIMIDDLLVSGMKAEGYRVMTNIDTFPTIDRKVKDYLIKTGVIQE